MIREMEMSFSGKKDGFKQDMLAGYVHAIPSEPGAASGP